jgi:hypothetical protein
MFVPLYIAALMAASLACALALAFQRLLSPNRCELVSTEWLSRFSVARYRPMQRLLSEEDYRFLERQQGYHPRLARRLRRKRIKVLRGYLDCIRSDFRRLEAAINFCVAHSPKDRPELAKSVLKKRLVFSYALMAVRFRLLLYALGLGTADIQGLIGSLDEMRVHLRRVALAQPIPLG